MINRAKFIGIVVLVTAIGFMATGCPTNGGGGDPPTFGISLTGVTGGAHAFPNANLGYDPVTPLR